MKALLGVGVLVAVVLGIVYWGATEENPAEATLHPNQITYFYGEGCPHCTKVAEFLDANKVAEKVVFQKLEVWKSRANAKLMQKAAEACGLDSKNVGVPFVYAEGKCFVGEPDVVKFFREKAGL